MPRMKKIKVKLISYLHYVDLIHRLNSKLDEVREEAVKEALALIEAG